MNPKKYKSLVFDIHKELGVDAELFNDVLDFYWADVRKNIVDVSYPRLNIENLGIFELKWKKLNDTIEIYKNKIKNLDSLNFSGVSRYKYSIERVAILEEAQRIMIEEINRKKNIKSKRNGDTTGSMEEEK